MLYCIRCQFLKMLSQVKNDIGQLGMRYDTAKPLVRTSYFGRTGTGTVTNWQTSTNSNKSIPAIARMLFEVPRNDKTFH